MAPSIPDQPSELEYRKREEIRRKLEQYVYVIEFSSDTVKVGRSGNPQARLAEHAKAAQAHGHSIARSWVSVPHVGFKENEVALIDFASARWPVAVGREAFVGADFASIVEYALGLPYERIAEDEVTTRYAAIEAAADGAHAYFNRRVTESKLHEITAKVQLIAPLVNDENRWAACDSFFDLLKEAVALEPAPWAHEDPMAAERYLTARGATVDRARQTASEFELNFRTLFALEHRREPKSFEEVARFCDSVTAGPTQLGLGEAS